MRDFTKFEKELTDLINRYSMENGSDTPDWILAQYLAGCLKVFNATVTAREVWYSRKPNSIAPTYPDDEQTSQECNEVSDQVFLKE